MTAIATALALRKIRVTQLFSGSRISLDARRTYGDVGRMRRDAFYQMHRRIHDPDRGRARRR